MSQTWKEYPELCYLWKCALHNLNHNRDIEAVKEILESVNTATDADNTYWQITGYIWDATEELYEEGDEDGTT